jgi:hypothetical protein
MDRCVRYLHNGVDFGTQQSTARHRRQPKQLKLIGKRRDEEQDVGVGTYDAENG